MFPPGVDHPVPDSATSCWLELVSATRSGTAVSFEDQWKLYEKLTTERDPNLPPLPAWIPDDERVAASNLATLMEEVAVEDYPTLHRWAAADRASFWERAIARLGIEFARPPDAVLDPQSGVVDARWLPGAELNIVDSCFRADPQTTALVLGREGSDTTELVTYGELEGLVNQVANGLVESGFGRGDAIALYMPMTFQCVAAYLGIVRAGCVVVSIADSFAAPEVARRLEIAGAVGVITVASFVRGGRTIAPYDTLCEAGAPRTVVISEHHITESQLRTGDLHWTDMLSDSSAFDSVTGAADTLVNVLFSSGTTGDPKAIPWTHLTPIKCATDAHYHQDIHPRDVIAWPTNIGWMMGPWLIFAALVNRACVALYEGAPTGAGFATFIERAGVTMLGVVPSLVRAWRDSGACSGVDWSGIRVFSSTGEPSNRRDYLWLMSQAGYRAPVIEYCGGTEIGGGHLTGTVVQPSAPATFSTAALGLDVVVLDDHGQEVGEKGEGEIFLIPPSVGLSQSLLNRDHRLAYYEGCPKGPNGEVLRRHGDRVARLPGGFYRAQGRTDDTMNLGGIKVSSLELERVLESHPAVFEAAAVAVQPEGEGMEKLVVFAVLGQELSPGDLRRELAATLSRELNPLFKIHDLVIVDSLPRTASNKLMRRVLRTQYPGR